MKDNLQLIILLLIFATYSTSQVKAQGCSDSGFCTMGAMRPDQIYPRKLNLRIYSLELTQHLGHTKFGDWIHSTFLDVNVGITRKTNLQLRLPSYVVIEGEMPTTRGWGDVFFSLTQNLLFNERYQVNATIGGKIYNKWSAEKRSPEGLSMPLYQQPSYGSNDFIMGLSIASRNYMFAAGYQHALNEIKNQFRPEDWAKTPLGEVVQSYPASAGLQRGDDLMLRAERNFRFSQWSFYAGVLNIVRLTKDKTLDNYGKLVSINGTQGLASNVLAGARYRINVKNSLKLLWSVKVLERKVNPDGLNRNFVGQLAYEFRF